MQHNQHTGHGDQRHYLRLVGMIVLSFISMYVLMYSMVNSFADVSNSLNQVYMAGLMTAPMAVIEVWTMSSMYKNRKLNAVVIVVSVAAGILFFAFIRQQTLISGRQFLRSMIPHWIRRPETRPIRRAENRPLEGRSFYATTVKLPPLD